jgi:hypothetical protein
MSLEAENERLRDLVKRSLIALNSTVQLARAEQQGHERTADRLDKEISAYRADARAALQQGA